MGKAKKVVTSLEKQPTSHAKSSEKHSAQRIGYTDAQQSFVVPPTRSFVQTFVYPKNWSLPSLVVLSIMSVEAYLTFFGNMSMNFHIGLFFFWRLWYNVGLGLMLHYQSNYRSLTRLYEAHSKKNTLLGRTLRTLASAGYQQHNVDTAPACLNAWFGYRHVVDLILVNDGWSYICLFIKSFTLPETFGTVEIVQFALGLALVAFNFWAKADAHRCIGDFAWYWEDFFYRVPQELVFDGIFEYFPHPMYTVGYSLYYGASIISRSYTVLLVSLCAHLLQITFLVLVENPHIERTYGTSQENLEEHRRILYDPQTGLFPDKKDTVLFVNADIFRVSDFALFGFVAYGLIFCFVVEDKIWCVVQALIWRLIHWLGLGSILWRQARSQYWTEHFISRGRSLYEAFDNWKRLYNLSLTMNLAVFVGAALRFATIPEHINSSFLASVAGGIVLMLLNAWSSHSAYEALGDFGWFYGDFFIPSDEYRPRLVYTGIYRFLNNPDCVTGYAGLYGLSLVSQSWTIFFLALACQLMNLAFLNLVEIPYMKQLYSDVRAHSPLVMKMSSKLKEQAKKVRGKALKEMYDIYKKLADIETANHPHMAQKVVLRAPEQIEACHPLEVEFETVAHHAPDDWIGIYDIQTPSMPGMSKGRWVHVPAGASGRVVFPPEKLPHRKTGGVCEIRYHLKGKYSIAYRVPIIIHPDPSLNPLPRSSSSNALGNLELESKKHS
eukprot:TRINITY_DN72_c0_g1_i1.p1 TRINITY_DN72_c0_g1~~TRINITY_DN72_c0_g1_i1.p1  ORF type:complete len:721 (+),score=200.99 TRINITY_DN72_c0_g1_i1:67-2229(+)